MDKNLVEFTDTNGKKFWLSTKMKVTCIRPEDELTHIFFDTSGFGALTNVYVKESVSVVKAVYNQ